MRTSTHWFLKTGWLINVIYAKSSLSARQRILLKTCGSHCAGDGVSWPLRSGSALLPSPWPEHSRPYSEHLPTTNHWHKPKAKPVSASLDEPRTQVRTRTRLRTPGEAPKKLTHYGEEHWLFIWWFNLCAVKFYSLLFIKGNRRDSNNKCIRTTLVVLL